MRKNRLNTQKISRRGFLGGIFSAFSFYPFLARAAAARVVIVGGGVAGLILARQLSQKSGGQIAVTLIEPRQIYTCCFASNAFLGGLRDFPSLTFGYQNMQGINFVRARVRTLALRRRQLELDDGQTVSWDRLVLAPGIECDNRAIDNYGGSVRGVFPHGWVEGAESVLLFRGLHALPERAVIILASGSSKGRSAMALYERATMMARFLVQNRPLGQLVILDSRERFEEGEVFRAVWSRYYGNRVEWNGLDASGGVVRAVRAGEIITENSSFKGDMIVPVPPERAPEFVRQAGLADASGFCPVNANSLESVYRSGIHILGDAAQLGPMPRDAATAQAHAGHCARHLLSVLAGRRDWPILYESSRYYHMERYDSLHLQENWRFSSGSLSRVLRSFSAVEDSDRLRRTNYHKNLDWYNSLTRAMFANDETL